MKDNEEVKLTAYITEFASYDMIFDRIEKNGNTIQISLIQE